MIKRALLGHPIATAQEMSERLPKKFALPVFASDAISSTAYATEEILLALVVAGTVAASMSIYVAMAVVILLVFVVLSYQQTVHAYPSGGGSYLVSKENLGSLPGMVAAASLMVGYVVTVAVSVASGVAAIVAAFPVVGEHRIWACVGIIILVTVANLRGISESARIFALPTYAFILLCGGLVVVGFVRWLLGDFAEQASTVAPGTVSVQGAGMAWIALRAFSGGCTAMTGTEAISNAVPVFKQPESKNASITLGVMAGLLAFLLLGVTFLSQVAHILPQDGTTVLGSVGRLVYGGGFFFYALQIATMAILILAANTSYTGFPRLASVLAHDGLMPRQFMNRGDKLVFSNGILGLMAAAIAVLLMFKAEVHKLIPIYAVGVFAGFTLSQAGMVVRWFRIRGRGWHYRALMNGLGALLTGVAVIVVLVAKFTSGSYLAPLAIFVFLTIFFAVHRHYEKVTRYLEPQNQEQIRRLAQVAVSKPKTTVVLFVSKVNELTARSLALGQGLSPDDFHAVTVAGNVTEADHLRQTWQDMGIKVPLLVVDSPYREFVRPALEYIQLLRPGAEHTVTVIIPEFVVEHWWENFLHNQNALRLKAALLSVPWVVTISIPFHIGK